MDLLVLILWIVVLVVIGWVIYSILKNKNLGDVRGSTTRLLRFVRARSVPTIRIVYIQGLAVLELGRRARLRENSLYDNYDKKGWDITSPAIPIKTGKTTELGFLTHPSGCTLSLVPDVKIIMTDEWGHAMKAGEVVYDRYNQLTSEVYKETKYIQASFEGTIGQGSELDDFDRSIGYEKEGGWLLPLVVGVIIGVVFLSPIFAWLMAKAGGH
jgi:hypothetical protein